MNAPNGILVDSSLLSREYASRAPGRAESRAGRSGTVTRVGGAAPAAISRPAAPARQSSSRFTSVTEPATVASAVSSALNAAKLAARAATAGSE